MSHGHEARTLSIRGRLFLGFSLLIIPIIAAVLLFLTKIAKNEVHMEAMANLIIPTQAITSRLDAQIYETQLSLYEYLMTQNPSEKANFHKVWEHIREDQKKMSALAEKNNNKEFVHKWLALNALYPAFFAAQNKLLATQNITNISQIKTLIAQEISPLMVKMINLIEGNVAQGEQGLFELQVNELNNGANAVLRNIDHLRLMNYALLLVVILLSVLVSWMTAKKILSPIKLFSEHSAKIAAGDLTQRLKIERFDEVGALGNDLNTMTEGLALITRKLTDASAEMRSLLKEIKQASDMQSTGVSEQASSINEITASLEEIDKSATQTMEKAKALGKISEQTSQRGQMGLDAVQDSINGMKAIHNKVQTIAKTILELSNQTQQIGEITTVVNTLALQSKMLALNASIEAAKAGEAGKGFAVVASEVKNLAEQSEQSTTQVQKILEDIRHATEKAVIVTEEGSKGVAEGTSIVEQMGDIMQSLTEAINETMRSSQQIEAAVRQESLGIEQITAGMNEINQVTASFVATVKQTTDLIEKLVSMAENIKNYVDVYKI